MATNSGSASGATPTSAPPPPLPPLLLPNGHGMPHDLLLKLCDYIDHVPTLLAYSQSCHALRQRCADRIRILIAPDFRLPARAYNVFRNATLVQVRVYNGYSNSTGRLYKLSLEKPMAADIEIAHVSVGPAELTNSTNSQLAGPAAAAALAAQVAPSPVRAALLSAAALPPHINPVAVLQGYAPLVEAITTSTFPLYHQQTKCSLNEGLDAPLRAGWASPGTGSSVASLLRTLQLLAEVVGSDMLLKMGQYSQ
jgi:hypothetical protein